MHSNYEIGNMAWGEGLSGAICGRMVKRAYMCVFVCNVCDSLHVWTNY